MKLFKMPVEIHRMNTLAELVTEFSVGKGDLILTTRSLKKREIQPLKLDAEVMVQKDYGSGEPNDIMIDRMRQELQGKNIRRVIAIGGGSVIDIAKILVFSGVFTTREFFEGKAAFRRERQLVVVPTTCGTGSEVTNLSVVEITAKGTKMGLGLDEMYPDYAVLIPCLLSELPTDAYMYSAIDALIHAAESYVAPRATVFTKDYSLKAMKMVIEAFRDLDAKGLDTRHLQGEKLLIASTYAGIAFGNAGVGAVHGLSYPLGGTYHVPHGEANYLFFVAVFQAYEAQRNDGVFAELTSYIAGMLQTRPEEAWPTLDALLGRLIPRKPLMAYQVTLEDVANFTDCVVTQQQRLINNSYVKLDRDTVEKIYMGVYYN